MNDSIRIHQLRIETVIGVHAWERTLKQTVLVDIEMFTDIRPAAANDDLTKALDYQAIAERVSSFISASRFQLIESMAEATADLILNEFNVGALILTIHKPGALQTAQAVSVRIERHS